jgi:hypothetical protein
MLDRCPALGNGGKRRSRGVLTGETNRGRPRSNPRRASGVHHGIRREDNLDRDDRDDGKETDDGDKLD